MGRFIAEDENIIHTLKSEIANNSIHSFLINIKKPVMKKLELIKNFKERENSPLRKYFGRGLFYYILL